jgi:seryl-tRNA synthetase
MIDIQDLRNDPDRIRDGIHAKGAGDPSVVDRAVELDERRRASITAEQDLRERANAAAKEIGQLMKDGLRDEAMAQRETSSALKQQVKHQEEVSRNLDADLRRVLMEIPNPTHPSVPVGKGAEDNAIERTGGDKPSFDFDPAPHWDLLEQHGMVDFERGAKVAGAGFPFYVGSGARLQRALINLFLDRAVLAGYTEIEPPIVVNEDSATGTGQLPDKEDQMYEIPRDGLYAIPTAEVPVTNFHRDEILEERALPVRFCAYTPCFRREAGSYGKDVRGLNRLHQFDKVEIVTLTRPGDSYEVLESMCAHAERLLDDLGLHYRTLVLCTGDMGFTQTKTFDLEVWSAGQERWLEVSSVSNFEAFQARRMNIRYRPDGGGKPMTLHTLNGSALALPRIVAAIVEHHQRADGSIALPPALQSYMGTDVLVASGT